MPLNTAKATVTLRSLTRTFDESVGSATPFYPRVSNVIPSDGKDEAYGMLGSMPGVREWLGERKFQELRAANFVIDNKHWESSLLIKKTDIDDDRMGMYGPLMQELAVEASYHPDELFFSALLAGESSACFDGQYFFDTDHSWGDSGTQSNDLAATKAGATATVDEFRNAFHAARAQMLKYKNDQGKLLNRPVSMGMSNLLLIVSPDMEVTAKHALTAALNSGGGTNVVVDAPTIVSTAYLTSNDKFYLFNLDGALRPFVFQAREPLTRQMKGLDDIETKDVKFMTAARYNIGYLAWWKSVLTTFA